MNNSIAGWREMLTRIDIEKRNRLQMYRAFTAMEAEQYSSLIFLLTKALIQCLTGYVEHTDAHPSSLIMLAIYLLYQLINNWSGFINCAYPCTSLFVQGKKYLNKYLSCFCYRGVLPGQLQGEMQSLQTFSDEWTHILKKIKIILYNQLKINWPYFCNIIYLNCKNRE